MKRINLGDMIAVGYSPTAWCKLTVDLTRQQAIAIHGKRLRIVAEIIGDARKRKVGR